MLTVAEFDKLPQWEFERQVTRELIRDALKRREALEEIVNFLKAIAERDGILTAEEVGRIKALEA
jgi:hypothetical protein